jgi:hypothetical protein
MDFPLSVSVRDVIGRAFDAVGAFGDDVEAAGELF